MKTSQPVIKWSGSKRSQAATILKYFPKDIDTYYEPFCGGASMLNALIHSGISVRHFICTDINKDLINLWNYIKCKPYDIVEYYTDKWKLMNEKKDSSQSFKREFYEKIRDNFNNKRNPLDFMFLDRTCFNGLIRYNSEGKFNSPYHLNRNGIQPDKFAKIVEEWSDSLNNNDVFFRCCSYEEIKTTENDFMYLDPPYANTKGMYFGNFNNEDFFKWLKKQSSKWILSYDGKSGEDDHTYEVPQYLYNEHVYIKSGNSSFKRIKETDKDAMVYESLYIKDF